MTGGFALGTGLHQGSALSTSLFAVMMDRLTKDVRRASPWAVITDDFVICSVRREQVEESVDGWRYALERRGEG